MKEITIQLTEQQEKFLKIFATNHYPGAKDNLATHHPIHVVQTKRIRHIPYNPEIADFHEYLPLVFSCDSDYRLWYKSETELIKRYYEHRDKNPSISVKSFKEIEYTDVYDTERNIIRVNNYWDYFKAYGIESVAIAWEEEEYEDAAFFFILEEARRYIKYQGHNLKEPRIYSFSAGYGNEGEYHHFYDLLLRLGEKLLAKSKVAI